MQDSSIIKIIAMYLPQFHEVKENNEWWGDGFTEWTAVKNAAQLFDGHNQPRVPLGENYYDLMDKKTMLWQASLMNEYGVDGLCFYHYYFENGKKILERPAENLLKWKEVDIDFFFCWATDTWARTWSGVSDFNSWADKYENDKENSDGILLRQSYGREKEWKEHFEYLLPFFMDKRYIKHEGKPIISIMKPHKIPCLRAMTEFWRGLATSAGLPGLYIIGADYRDVVPYLDAMAVQSPHMFWNLIDGKMKNGIRCCSFDKTWRSLLDFECTDDHKIFLEGVGDLDDTPRRSTYSGVMFDDYSCKKLEDNMVELLLKSYCMGNEMVLFNAWNEWGEGMYLEPDENERFSRLDAIRCAKTKANDIIRRGDKTRLKKYYRVNRFSSQSTNDIRLIRAENRADLLDKLLHCIDMDIDISELLKSNGARKVAIYGMASVGIHLAKELERRGMSILYAIDKNKDKIVSDYPVFSIEEKLPIVDAIIISSVYYFDEIYELLRARFNGAIYSVEELLWTM